MTQADDEFEDDYELGPSLAMPPLYTIRTIERCPECGGVVPVFTLGCAAFHDAEDSRPVEVFHMLRIIRKLPDQIMSLVRSRCPGFYLDTEEEGDTPYLMNHCPCGAKFDDDFMHGDIGAAFWPDTPGGFARLRLSRLPVQETIEVECTYIIGGEEYLRFDTAEEA